MMKPTSTNPIVDNYMVKKQFKIVMKNMSLEKTFLKETVTVPPNTFPTIILPLITNPTNDPVKTTNFYIPTNESIRY